MKQQYVEWISYAVSAGMGVALHWTKQWQEAWQATPTGGTKPSFKSVLWHSPPDALLSLLGTATLIGIGHFTATLNVFTALMAGYSGDSATDQIAKKVGQ